MEEHFSPAGAGGTDREGRARALLLEETERCGSLAEVDLEALCAAHPALAQELRRLHAGCTQLDAMLDRLRLGLDQEPRAGLAPAPESASGSLDDGSAALEFVRRLQRRPPVSERYSVVAERGRGAMGTVFEVWDEDLRRPLAMKVARNKEAAVPSSKRGSTGLPSDLDSRQLARFLDEARIMGQLEHPGLVPVHELGIDEASRIYFTMSLVQGQDLRSVFERVRAGDPEWSRTRVLNVLLKVCETLAYAHEKGIVHRDLKPANVMVGSFGEVYVMDWGLARVLRDGPAEQMTPAARTISTLRGEEARHSPASAQLSQEGDVVGTPCYMAPEQARGSIESLDERADVYAVGAMIYELLAGSPPYARTGDERRSARAVIVAVLEGAPQPLAQLARELPPELEAITERAMAREPAERYPSTFELARDLRAFLEDRVVSAHRTGPVVELRKWVRRNRRVATLGAALVLVALGATGLVAWRESTRKRELGEANTVLAAERDEKQRLADANLLLADEQRLMADLMGAKVLLGEADSHAPDAEGVAALGRWVERAGDLAGRGELYARGPLPGAGASIGVEEFDELRTNIERLGELLPGARARLDTTSALPRRTLEDPAALWASATAAIAANPHYAGLELAPQLGLIPLREDPESGLWEFWHVLNGERPHEDPRSGRWVIAPETGIVLVLMPSGRYAMGSPIDEPGRGWNESQLETRVAPFFLSRYETTQAQWLRDTGRNPAHFQLSESRSLGVPLALTHPVESVSWNEVAPTARRLGLRLPSEEEWEYACRAGSDARFHWGPDLLDLEGRTNVADQGFLVASGGTDAAKAFEPAEWDDSFPFTAPVGSFPANAFGLHDMHGNVSEWTHSEYWSDHGVLRGPKEAPLGDRVGRGGNYMWGPAYARCASRQPLRPSNANRTLGVRFARTIDP